MGLFRRSRPGPVTDVQNRLRYIEKVCDELRAKDGSAPDVRNLAYLVGYLAAIVEKHLREGER